MFEKFFFFQKKQVNAILSDIPYEENFYCEQHDEEPDLVPIESSRQGCEIITDPDLIRQMDEEAALKFRFKNVPLSEPWFCKKQVGEVEHFLMNKFHINGYFLVTAESSDNSLNLVLNVMFNEVLHQFKINQVRKIHIYSSPFMNNFSSL